MDNVRARVLVAVLALALALLAGCARQAGRDQPAEPSPGATSPAETSPTESTSTETSPTAQSAEGDVGDPVTVGIWTITVRGAEDREEVDGVRAAQGALIRVEIDVRNGGDTPFSVQTGDWRLEAAGTEYRPVQTPKPEERGEREVGAGETEDVKVSFDVPTGESGPVLVFTPAGQSASARVRLR